jgi:hypothetical protein
MKAPCVGDDPPLAFYAPETECAGKTGAATSDT